MEDADLKRLRDVTSLLRPVLGFGREGLGLDPYGWQHDSVILLEPERMKMRTRIAVVAPNGSGKSGLIIPWALFYWLYRWKQGRVVITSASQRQLAGQLWPSVEAFRPRFPDYRFRRNPHNVETESGGLAEAFSTDDANLAEGFHPRPGLDGPLLMIIDEAKSVHPSIWDAINRCTYAVLLVVSSGGRKVGPLWNAMLPDSDWVRIQAGLTQCPHIPQEKIDQIIKDYGINHPFTRSSLFGEFMHVDDGFNYVFEDQEVRDLYDSPPPAEKGHSPVYACDFGGPAAECVIARKLGNVVSIVDAWRGQDTASSTGRFISNFAKRGMRAEDICGDTDGIGLKFCDDLRTSGWDIRRFHGGAKANRSEYYKNRISEAWHETSRLVRDREIILPTLADGRPDDLLVAQLTGRRDKWSESRRWLESKDEMRLRGMPSPDRGDAVCMVSVMQSLTRPPLNTSSLDVSRFLDQLSGRESPQSLLPGMDAGR